MEYFLTGATGFIGRHLMECLVARGGTFHLLVRENSLARFETLVAGWRRPGAEIRAVIGDVAKPNLGIEEAALEALRGRVDHFFQIAAVYDLNVDRETAQRVNVEGTRHALDVARRLELGGCHHHVSSIAVAGRYRGRFLECMFDEGQELDHPYFESKFQSEALVRSQTDVPFRIYRPGSVVGHSETGVMDKIDGPYLAFKPIQQLRELVPPWFPLIGPDGGALPIVPVDFVARAIDHLAHAPDLDGRTFHLVDPQARGLGDALNIFCRAAHAPEFAMRVEVGELTRAIPGAVRGVIAQIPAVQSVWHGVLEDHGIPPSALRFADIPTVFDSREAQAALAGTGITCPPLDRYAWRLWDYWERHLDPDLQRPQNLAEFLAGKVVVVTGASSGIGREVARKIARHGGLPLLLARRTERLDALAEEIREAGGDCRAYPVDLSDLEACDRVVERILREHGHIDVLINNAGRSIRRSLRHSVDRFHDFERTMQLNYFAAVRLIMGFLPSMRERKQGHIVNISSAGGQVAVPRFAAYVASKTALDSFAKSLSGEVLSDGIDVTTVYMPLVRTEMIAPTRLYDMAPALSPSEAGDLVVNALLDRPKSVRTRLGTAGAVLQALFPNLADRILNTIYRVMPESSAGLGEGAAEGEAVPAEAIVVANLLRGIHL